MLRIAICDPVAKRAQMLFERCGQVIGKVGARCELTCHKNGEKICAALEEDSNYYDVYILNGTAGESLALASHIREKTLIPAMIFILPREQQLEPLLRFRLSAVTAGEADGEMEAALERCCREQLQCRGYFTVKNRDSFLRIPYEQIITVESRQRLCVLRSSRQVVEFYAKLKEVEAKLPGKQFLRCHQSYLVNMTWISRLDKANRCFVLRDGHTVEISRSSYANAVERYTEFINRE